MKRLTTSILVSIAVAALPVALALGQSSIPPVYDSTGAMLTAIAPQPTANPRAYPWVYDATGAMQAAVAPQPARLGEAPVLQADLVEASENARLEAQADLAARVEIERIYGHVDLPAGQDAIPPVYDATGAMLIALEPGPLEGNMAAVESRTVPDNGLIDPVERAYIERAMTNTLAYTATTTNPNAATQGIAGYIEAHEAVNVQPAIPSVYDATGVMQAAIVQSSEADAAALATPSVASAPSAVPSTELIVGVGLLAAASLIGAWMLNHRPATRQHGPRHV